MDELRWNKEFALDQADGDEELLHELIDLFIESSVKAGYPELLRHLRAGNARGIVSSAHGIKGAAASLGFESIREQAKEIESIAREGKTVDEEKIGRLGILLKMVRDLRSRAV
ncbi:MAG: Hpt domain-containing protein [Desulfobulbaceae bacterium]|nr:Hpt domain-containing protein [Desulfobulbaceae bacterium]